MISLTVIKLVIHRKKYLTTFAGNRIIMSCMGTDKNYLVEIRTRAIAVKRCLGGV